MERHGKGSDRDGVGPGDEPLTVRRVRLDDLHADPANTNTHDGLNLRTIRDSLREFGQVEPLVVHKGTNKVIGGNGRLAVMRDLGITEADVVEFDGDNVRATALGIALNRTAKTSSFDDTALAETLRALQSEDFPVEAAGFTDAEVDALIGRLGDGRPEGDEVEDPAGEWEGMPEFQHEDQTSQFRAIVHFATEADMRAFEELVGQKIPTNTRAIWYPRAERQTVKGSGYVSDEP
jgi:ParB-like chromosome segregation protein Spo0J